jgi:S1-C subfamily serine protease
MGYPEAMRFRPQLLLCLFFPSLLLSQPGLDLNLVRSIAAHLGRSVVHINATFEQDKEAKRPVSKPLFTPEGGPRDTPPLQKTGQGSGFLIRSDGTILTNEHVIENAAYLEVVLDNGFRYQAEVVGQTAAYDLAVIKIDDPLFDGKLDEDLIAPLGDSRRSDVGDWVMAIGSPLSLDRSVTLGIISAQGRELHIGKDRTYYNLIQTDAAINPGNSGGPLIELREGGKVIGINTAINAAGQGLGFAIPINLARKIARDLEEVGKVRPSWIGVDLSPLSTKRALKARLTHARAVLISGILPNSPAKTAGLEVGDIVLSAAGDRVKHPTHLLEKISETPVGDSIMLQIVRGRSFVKANVEVEVKEAPSNESGKSTKDQIRISADTFGAVVRVVTTDDRVNLRLPKGFEGVLVVAVSPGSPAFKAGLRPSDAIASVALKDVTTPAEFDQTLENVEPGQTPKLGVFRSGYWIFLPK